MFGGQDHEQKLSDLYDMLLEQGMDSNLISTVFEKMSSTDSKIDEESVWFETQFTQFDNQSDPLDRKASDRRSGVKKVDDEYLIHLAKRTSEEQKKREEQDLK